MSRLGTALSRVNLRDSYVMRETADLFVSHLTRFAAMTTDQAEAETQSAFVGLEQAYGYGSPKAEDRKPFVYQDGFAIIPIHGALLNRFGGAYSFATGYNYIRRMMQAAMDDSDVQVIVLDVDSPGGESAGCLELADEIREMRDSKPIMAVVDSLSCSAGFALASAAMRMYATPSSQIGSIGVYRMHIDLSGSLDQQGVKITFIEAPDPAQGGMKTAGNPYNPLDDAARQLFQDGVNRSYDEFCRVVSDNRGIPILAVQETQAKVFRADEALALRLIDAVKTPAEAVAAFMAELADESDPGNLANDEEEEVAMLKPGSEVASAPAAVAAAPVATGLTAADVTAAVQAAMTADRDRMTAIKALPEAADKPKLADKMALEGYSVDQAKSLLSAASAETPAPAEPAKEEPKPGEEAPKPAAGDQTNHFAAAMGAAPKPNVGAGGTEAAAPGAEPTDAELAASILADQAGSIGLTKPFGFQAAA